MATSIETGVIIAETPVFTMLIFTYLGYWSRSLKTDNNRRDTALAKQSEALAVIVAAQAPLEQRLMNVERRQQTLSEATAVLSATIERYEIRRERFDSRPHSE